MARYTYKVQMEVIIIIITSLSAAGVFNINSNIRWFNVINAFLLLIA